MSEKHKAIIFIDAEIQDCLKTGECSGRVVFKIDRFPLTIDGSDLNDATKRLNETLAELKQTCLNQQR